MTAIRIDIVDKTYPSQRQSPGHRAIADLKLELPSNEFICLVGPSGCGKTTLLNILAGLDRDYRGEITVEHRHKTPKIGYVFQNPRLLPWKTVRENITLALPTDHDPKTVDALLDTMQLTDAQQVYPERLSLGMSRRVSIIRAFAIDPDVLLMDEPFVSLDAPTARQVRELLIRLWQQRPHTVLFVTHDLREAIALADRLVFLSSPPMQAISEIRVNIPRDKRDDETAIEAFRQKLLQDHPEIRALL
ncbi:ABC transporter ATP-binding protein [Methylotuvimicrobium buryatense]|uniref:ABC transporter ATP-binding protein n=1 Tax=Methylotuvimicrobium buryatense TaxID=95641 RepID=A0A4V1IK95_METBY|nr:ABC transporter ATP-binding protein [Methylotuvimicrobium buryatense]QCW84125.1 ABC transporter ATP-binding protein [Methylotuvimicrobium buryatense]